MSLSSKDYAKAVALQRETEARMRASDDTDEAFGLLCLVVRLDRHIERMIEESWERASRGELDS